MTSGLAGSSRSNSAASMIATACLPRTVTYCGPWSWARLTTSLNLAFASSNLHVARGDTVWALDACAALRFAAALPLSHDAGASPAAFDPWEPQIWAPRAVFWSSKPTPDYLVR